MNHALMFSKASDEWSTPQDFYDVLNREFRFATDAAATRENCIVNGDYFGPDNEDADFRDALAVPGWWAYSPLWLNPPYSKYQKFMEKAAYEASRGATIVCLVPSRTDTRWWHDYVWDGEKHQPRRGVEIRFIRGRLKFGEGKNSAPFPSVIVIFRGQ